MLDLATSLACVSLFSSIDLARGFSLPLGVLHTHLPLHTHAEFHLLFCSWCCVCSPSWASTRYFRQPSTWNEGKEKLSMATRRHCQCPLKIMVVVRPRPVLLRLPRQLLLRLDLSKSRKTKGAGRHTTSWRRTGVLNWELVWRNLKIWSR